MKNPVIVMSLEEYLGMETISGRGADGLAARLFEDVEREMEGDALVITRNAKENIGSYAQEWWRCSNDTAESGYAPVEVTGYPDVHVVVGTHGLSLTVAFTIKCQDEVERKVRWTEEECGLDHHTSSWEWVNA